MRLFPTAEEGELSRRLADLVRRESCAEVAARMGRRGFSPARRRRAAGRHQQQDGDPLRHLRIADRRGFSRRRLCGGESRGDARFRAAHACRRGGRCAIPRPPCRNGRRRAASTRRSIARSPAAGPHHAPEFTMSRRNRRLCPGRGERHLETRAPSRRRRPASSRAKALSSNEGAGVA